MLVPVNRNLRCRSCYDSFDWPHGEKNPEFCPKCGDYFKVAPPHAPNAFHPFVLAQDKIWVDTYGYEHLISEMDRSYQANVLAMLFREVARFRDIYMQESEIKLEKQLGYFPGRHWITPDSIHREQDNSWMARSPLVRKLMAELSKHEDHSN